MRKYQFNKLIRSQLPARMAEEGIIINAHKLEPLEYMQKLKQKIVEEAYEVEEAESREDLRAELADVLEVVYTIAKSANISVEEIEEVRLEKREINGYFKPENYINYIEVAHDNHKVIEYLEKKNRPYKFSSK